MACGFHGTGDLDVTDMAPGQLVHVGYTFILQSQRGAWRLGVPIIYPLGD